MSVIFDTTQYLTRGAALTGVSASAKGTMAVWLKRQSTGVAQTLFTSGVGATGIHAGFLGDDTFNVRGYNAATTEILDITSSALTSTSIWYHIVASWDLGASATHLFVNRASDVTENTVTDDVIDYTVTNLAIGADTDGTDGLDAKAFEVLFLPGVYFDLSDGAELKKFVSSDGLSVSASDPFGAGEHIATIPSGVKPVGYGHNFDRLGTSPAVAFSNSWHKNRGTGGPFALTGSFATVSSPDIPNAYRLASHGGRVGERWFDSEKSGMSASRSQTFIERRPGHPDYGKRLRSKDERDEETRDLVVANATNWSTLINPREDDSLEGPRV